MSKEAPSPYLELPGFTLDLRRRLLLRRETGEVIALNSKAFDTLLYLAQHPGEVLDKDTLLGAVWPGVVVEENNLAQNISALRQALGETHGENRYIATVPRRGYQFVAQVNARSELPAAIEAPVVTTVAPLVARGDGCWRCCWWSGPCGSGARVVSRTHTPHRPAPCPRSPYCLSNPWCLPSVTSPLNSA